MDSTDSRNAGQQGQCKDEDLKREARRLYVAWEDDESSGENVRAQGAFSWEEWTEGRVPYQP